MTAYYYKNIPDYHFNQFRAVRDVYDNLFNLLQIAEILNTNAHCRVAEYDPDFSFIIFTGEYTRVLIRKCDGYFSMGIPFQVIDHGDRISFNCDLIREEVSGQFISIMRNAIKTSRDNNFSHEEIVLSIAEDFNLDVPDAVNYFDAFISVAVEDHGYFRFDDDPMNANGDLHPRYHFDFFYKNSTTMKIGADTFFDISNLLSLIDSTYTKYYLRK